MQQIIIPNLWFNGNAKEAVDYYLSIFKDSELISTSYYPGDSEEGLADFQQPLAGKELTLEFKLNGQRFTAINADSTYAFTPAVSFAVSCKDQAEIDYYWGKLSANPEAEQCGWCQDEYGLSWQIVPENMAELMERPGAFEKMMQMHKLVIADF